MHKAEYSAFFHGGLTMSFIEDAMNNQNYWAHTQHGKNPETLKEHSSLCLRYYKTYCKKKGIRRILKNAIRKCGCDERETEDIYNMLVDAVYQHDIGKINPTYQSEVLGNTHFAHSHNSRNHALLSAYIYMYEHLVTISKHDRKKYSYFLFSFSYCIARHHGYLKNIDDFKENLQYCIEKEGCYDKVLDLEKNSIFTAAKDYDRLKGIIHDETAFYILNKLLFSILAACDYCATSEYMNGIEVDICVIEGAATLREKYQSGKIFTGIKIYEQDPSVFANSINELRCQMFMESEKNLRKNPGAHLYYLEAPTGSGKTNMSINLFLTILEQHPELNNMFYIFPFNTLVEQTAEVLGEYFTYGEDMAVVNSITPIYVKPPAAKIKRQLSGIDEDESYDFETAALNKIFNNYPLVVTSHVNFFNDLFGTRREQCFPLVKLCNSVIVIDEIQSYRNKIWRQIILFLLKYAELLNLKICIMSATLPKLDILLDQHEHNIADLIRQPEVYYQNPFFKNRVTLDFSLLHYQKIDLDLLLAEVLKYKDKKVLVEFISKTTAREFFNMCRLKDDILCVEITGDDNVRSRKDMIKLIKSAASIIVVATQVIEAGVDIDMDVGFKDISLPDAEEQFLGRINRSCLKQECKAYFFNYDDARKVYGDDERINYPIMQENIADMLQNKNFKGIYELILQDVKRASERMTIDNIYYTYEACLKLRYQDIEERMRLIPPTNQIFLAYTMHLADEIIDGREVWAQYKNICGDTKIGYGEKKVALSRIAEKISYFTYTAYTNKGQPISCDEEFGGYCYIENGEQFIEDGKFNRKAFNNYTGGLFL